MTGLALSSRNGYLEEAERAQAVQLSQAPRALADAALQPGASLPALGGPGGGAPAQAGPARPPPTVRQRADFAATSQRAPAAGPTRGSGRGAPGGTRLIDNGILSTAPRSVLLRFIPSSLELVYGAAQGRLCTRT